MAPREGGLTPGADLPELPLKGQILRAYPLGLQKESQNHSGFQTPASQEFLPLRGMSLLSGWSVAAQGGARQLPAKFGVADFGTVPEIGTARFPPVLPALSRFAGGATCGVWSQSTGKDLQSGRGTTRV